jgi:hypothetical protein
MIRVFETFYFIVISVAISAEKIVVLWLDIYHQCLVTFSFYFLWNVSFY